ncbi:MAG TPA: aminotransferase class I/II-fold pyridoxal phosphate-dependent enzyme [Acidimicrobiales bacterium]|nr:aminotransferase class I/II-fold pyridoxal phosphate-dependent enzyme [Acidimicrobiales bacterium]
MTGGAAAGFVPPAYPYDRLDRARALAAAHEGGVVDLSVGTPCDPPPAAVVDALARSGTERGYPASVGSPALREAAAGWLGRRLGAAVEPAAVAACVGTKEFVATTPQWMRLRRPDRDTVLYPAVSYPTYEMGAVLAGLRAVAVPVDTEWRLRLDAVSEEDAARALLLWVNTPGNPAGQLDDLEAAATWGRAHGVPVFSDECYAEFTWDGPPRTVLAAGSDGVVAVHSLSKRSNLAGVRVGFYAGDADLVHYLSEVRKHAGLMVPGPVQAAAVVALSDQGHVEEQRERYRSRLERFAKVLAAVGTPVPLPGGGFYLWPRAPEAPDGRDPAWALTERLAAAGGVLVSPGEFYGAAGAAHVRVALVAPDDRLDLVARRLGV